jgi:tRNA-uridine 2-sulfurtransferase
MLGQDQLSYTLFPVGEMTKAQVRREAHRLGLRTADKPDSQDVCFIRSDQGRQGFLGDRLPLHEGRLVDHDTGDDLGPVDAVELVTVGQRRGMGHSPDGQRRFVTAVDVPTRRVSLGNAEAALAVGVELHTVTWIDADPWGVPDRTGSTVDPVSPVVPVVGVVGVPAIAQCSAHGRPVPCTLHRVAGSAGGSPLGLSVTFEARQRRIAPGQTVALYDPDAPDLVIGSGIAR